MVDPQARYAMLMSQVDVADSYDRIADRAEPSLTGNSSI
jgi:hypothetical protein